MGTELTVILDLRIASDQVLDALNRDASLRFDFSVPLSLRKDPFTVWIGEPLWTEPLRWQWSGSEIASWLGWLRLYPRLAVFTAAAKHHKFVLRPSMQIELRMACAAIARVLGSSRLLYLPDDIRPWCDAFEYFEVARSVDDLIVRHQRHEPSSKVVPLRAERDTRTYRYSLGEVAFVDDTASLLSFADRELRDGAEAYVRRQLIRATEALASPYEEQVQGFPRPFDAYWELISDWWTQMCMCGYFGMRFGEDVGHRIDEFKEVIRAMCSARLGTNLDEYGAFMGGQSFGDLRRMAGILGRGLRSEKPAE